MTKEEIQIASKLNKFTGEIEINGIYIIPTNEEFHDGSYYDCIEIIGYNYDENKEKRYYNLDNCHDVVNLMNFGMSGVSIDVEHDNSLVRVFWNDRKPRKIKSMDTILSIFTIYGEEII